MDSQLYCERHLPSTPPVRTNNKPPPLQTPAERNNMDDKVSSRSQHQVTRRVPSQKDRHSNSVQYIGFQLHPSPRKMMLPAPGVSIIYERKSTLVQCKAAISSERSSVIATVIKEDDSCGTMPGRSLIIVLCLRRQRLKSINVQSVRRR